MEHFTEYPNTIRKVSIFKIWNKSCLIFRHVCTVELNKNTEFDTYAIIKLIVESERFINTAFLD